MIFCVLWFFCDRGAGESDFLATDIRRQVFILCGSPLYWAMSKTTFFRYLCTFKLSPKNWRPILPPPPKILPCLQSSMYADCRHIMIFDGGVSIGRLILGESLLLGSTEDNTFVSFFLPRVWYCTIQPLIFFFFLFFFFFDQQSSTILLIKSLRVCPIRSNVRRWRREAEAEVEERGGGWGGGERWRQQQDNYQTGGS